MLLKNIVKAKILTQKNQIVIKIKEIKLGQNSKIKWWQKCNLKLLQNSNYGKAKKLKLWQLKQLKCWQKSKILIVTKQKFWENSKTQIVSRLKKSNCEKNLKKNILW